MANVLIAFYNAIVDEENPNAMPLFYQNFIEGLDRAGNQVFVFSHRFWGRDFETPDEEIKKKIQEIKPDICFIFNNLFYDLKDVVDCPIVIYEVDSPWYFGNKKILKEFPDRYLFFIVQTSSRHILEEEFKVPPKNIFYVPLFSEIYAENIRGGGVNISFIGSKFTKIEKVFSTWFAKQKPTRREREMLLKCVKDIRENPFITTKELIYGNQITSELVAKSLNIPHILMCLSSEKRIRILSAVADLGLDLYGTRDWIEDYYYDCQLNLCYIDKKVYSNQHNQEILNNSRIGINISHLQAKSGFPWRVMDIMASNACLVTDYHDDFELLFPNLKLPIYETPQEARALCQTLIMDEEYRKDIVLQCQEVIESRYRFRHLLARIEEYSGVRMHKEKTL